MFISYLSARLTLEEAAETFSRLLPLGISLLEDLGYTTTDLLLSGVRSPDDLQHLEQIVEAGADAFERVLGAPVGSFQRNWREELAPWLAQPS